MMRALFTLSAFMLLSMEILEAFYFLSVAHVFFILAVEGKSHNSVTTCPNQSVSKLPNYRSFFLP